MSSNECEDEIMRLQGELNKQVENMGDVQAEIRKNRIEYGLLKDKEFKAEEVIRRTKQEIKNIEGVFKWRALRKEKGTF